MDETKSICDLAADYRADEQRLTAQINRLLPYAKSLSGDKRRTAYRNLACLYEMRRDVRLTAETLEHYYDNRLGKRVYHKDVGAYIDFKKRK